MLFGDKIKELRNLADMSQQELEKQLERKKKPFTQKEIEMIVEEGRKMGEEYGKKIKRIGNGCG